MTWSRNPGSAGSLSGPCCLLWMVLMLPRSSAALDFVFGNPFEDGCQTDSDSDRLPDCFESGDNRDLGPMHTGTSRTLSDTDVDGLVDGDEVLGTASGIDLPAMGARALRKTVLAEYDWFDDANGCASHSHRPTAAIASATAAAFAAMPVSNPDGTTGIDLVQDYGQGGLFTGGNRIADADGDLAGGVNGTEFAGYKAAHFASTRFRLFHYVIFPHTYNGSASSGQAERPGDDLIVSLGCSGASNNVRNTLLHEIGHNFSLSHGGADACNYKPNYNSVMNYRYQFPGIDNNCSVAGDGVPAYSVGTRPNLDENALNEAAGICGLTAGVAVDWNANATIEPLVIVDINASDTNQASNCGGSFSVLRDSNDYAALNLAHVRTTPDRAVEVVDCDNPVPGDAGTPTLHPW